MRNKLTVVAVAGFLSLLCACSLFSESENPAAGPESAGQNVSASRLEQNLPADSQLITQKLTYMLTPSDRIYVLNAGDYTTSGSLYENSGSNIQYQIARSLEQHGSTLLSSGTTLAELIRRPELSYEILAPVDEGRPQFPADLAEEIMEQINISIKYEGYIRRQEKQVEQFRKLEKKRIPEDIDYDQVKSLRIEAVQKLKEYRPVSIGQASRISGVSPADISVLLIYLGGVYGKDR